MRLGTMLSMPGDPCGTQTLVERAAAAEAAGFASVWLPQVNTIDALMSLALAGRDTRTIELGTAVVPTYPRHPMALAAQALTVQDATRNRLALGIGLSHRFFIEDNLGMDYSKPIPHMRDYLTILNGLLAGERVQHGGTEYTVNTQVSVAGAKKPAVIVAALGPGDVATLRSSRRRYADVDGRHRLSARHRGADDERRSRRSKPCSAALRRDGADVAVRRCR